MLALIQQGVGPATFCGTLVDDVATEEVSSATAEDRNLQITYHLESLHTQYHSALRDYNDQNAVHIYMVIVGPRTSSFLWFYWRTVLYFVCTR